MICLIALPRLRLISGSLGAFFSGLILAALIPGRATAEPIPAKQKQGAMDGFLVVKSTENKVIAVGDQINTMEGDRVRSRLTLHFRDGSIDDELCVFTQGKVFQLVTDHHIQRGPSFPQPIDIAINVPKGSVTWREKKNREEQVHTEHMNLPADVANGLTSLIVENFPSDAREFTVSYLAGSSKPRMVKLVTRPDGEDTFHLAGTTRRAKRYRIHVELGGVAGVVAPLIGKQPSDLEMWAVDGEVPTFLKMEGPLYDKGPIWTTELDVPVWPEPEHGGAEGK